MEQSVPRPLPELTAEPINSEQYQQLTPEKLERWGGYLIDDKEHPDERLDLLSLLLRNVGLIEAVKLAPRELWESALAQAYHG